MISPKFIGSHALKGQDQLEEEGYCHVGGVVQFIADIGP